MSTKLSSWVDKSKLMICAQVLVKDAAEKLIRYRALLDTCLTAHFIIEKVVQKLEFEVSPCFVPTGKMTTVSKSMIEL